MLALESGSTSEAALLTVEVAVATVAFPLVGGRWALVAAALLAILGATWPSQVCVAAWAIGAAGIGALVRRAVRDRVVAQARAVAVATLLPTSLAWALVLVRAGAPAAETLTAAAAINPLVAALRALDIDPLRLPEVYARTPVAQMEVRYVAWWLTALILAALGLPLLARR